MGFTPIPMLPTLVSTLLLLTGLILPLTLQPLLFGALIILIALLITTLIAFLNTPWYAYILFLIFIGGLLVIFAYISALIPNSLFTFPPTKICFFLYPPSIFLLYYLYLPSPPVISTSFQHITHLTSKITNYLYHQTHYPLLMLLLFLLLLILTVVVKICYLQKGPLRPYTYLISISSTFAFQAKRLPQDKVIITNIFSSFDLHNLPSINLSTAALPWVITFIVIPLLFSSLFLAPSRGSSAIFLTIQFLYEQTRRTNGIHLTHFPALTIRLFFLILFTNLLSLVPYVIGPTAHIAFTFSLAFPVWLTIVISGIHFNPYHWLAALLPLGAPTLLAPFLVIVEAIRNLLRALTLPLRLAANLTVGHVILAALGTYTIYAISSSSLFLAALITLTLATGFILFEVGVAALQAYVFFLLATLYSNDHPIY